MHSGRTVAFGAGLTLALLGAHVAAQAPATGAPVPSLDLRDFRPPTDPNASLALEPTRSPDAGEWNVGAWASYAHRQVRLDAADGSFVRPLRHQVALDYVGGVGLGRGVFVGAALPTVVYQTGDDARLLVPEASPLPHTAFGDLRLTGKLSLTSPGSLGGVGLAVLEAVTLPTGNPYSYVAEAGPTGETRLLAELNMLAFVFRSSAGVRLRSEQVTFPPGAGQSGSFGNTLPWAAGVTFRPQSLGIDPEGRWRWMLEGRGLVALDPHFGAATQSPALLTASARYGLEELSLLGGVEVPLDGAAGLPSVRAVLAVGWAPRAHDVDQDGIEDAADQCPELPEDPDGFADTDGCPDFDNDDDGVPDEEDRCPTTREDEDGVADEDGCPDPDDDGDGVPDVADACPKQPATRGLAVPGRAGCPALDADRDGVLDPLDRCPSQAEDRDGFEDDDGCVDADNDRDGLPDAVDACPLVRGLPSDDEELRGCPDPDPDGDTIDAAIDRCPQAKEDFDGDADEDGCPDDDSAKPAAQRAKPLVTVALAGPQPVLRWRERIAFEGDDVAKQSLPVLRALASELEAHPDWLVAVGVRPAGADAQAEQSALTRAFAIAGELRELTHRDDVAETLGWSAVRGVPGAARDGVGMLVLVPRAATASAQPAVHTAGRPAPGSPPVPAPSTAHGGSPDSAPAGVRAPRAATPATRAPPARSRPAGPQPAPAQPAPTQPDAVPPGATHPAPVPPGPAPPGAAQGAPATPPARTPAPQSDKAPGSPP